MSNPNTLNSDEIYPAWKTRDGTIICAKEFDDVCYLAGCKRVFAVKRDDKWYEIRILRWEFVE